MKNETDKIESEGERVDITKGDVGDVEMAGETTAAAAITGPDDTSPVGAETLAKVDDRHSSSSSRGSAVNPPQPKQD